MADVAPGGSPDQPAHPPAGQTPVGWSPADADNAPDPGAPPSVGTPPSVGAVPSLGAVPTVGAQPILGAVPGPVSAAPGTAVLVPGATWSGPDGVPPDLPHRRGWRRWLPLGAVIGLIAVCAIAMLVFLGYNFGIAGLVIGLVAAILPVPVLVGCFLWLDRYEPEPTRYLVFCFAWGAAVATAVALLVNTSVAWLFEQAKLPDALVAVLVAPFIEETMKALGPVLLLWKRRREWSGITDGIVYCGISAIGFAMVENVLYLGGHGYAAGADQYGPATGIQNVFLIFIVRIVFTGFAHPLFTSMTGIGLGISSRSPDRRVRWLAPIAGLLLAMMLHGTFNLLPTLSVATGQPLIMLYGYIGFMVPLFFAMVGVAIALRGWEGRLSERILPFYVRTGWFSPPEMAALGSLGRRHSARRWARRVAGVAGVKAMREFQFAATQLALLRDGMQRGLDRKPEDVRHATDEERRLLTAITAYRSTFVGRDPQAPQAFWDGSGYRIAFPDGVTRAVPAPEEPVVPVPVRLAPPVPVAAGWGAPGPQFAPSPGYAASPSYGSPAGYGAPTPYGPSGGYASPSGYAPAQGYGAPGYSPAPGYAPGYSPAPGYPPAGGYPSNPVYPPPSAYGVQPGGFPPGYGVQPGSVPPGYGVQPGSVPPGYGVQPGSVPPGYGIPPGSAPPGYGVPPGSAAPGYGVGAQPAYGAPPSYGTPPAYEAQPSAVPPPSGAGEPAHSPHPSHGNPPGMGPQNVPGHPSAPPAHGGGHPYPYPAEPTGGAVTPAPDPTAAPHIGGDAHPAAPAAEPSPGTDADTTAHDS
ncbi:hypothetical protein KRM28CT15_65600 [Krasilnikovia sp. M28-CT-15]